MYMLPKIAVGVFIDRIEFLNKLSLSENTMMCFEGTGAKVDDFRSWIYCGVNILRTHPNYSMIVWDADKLSPENQAVLLKPMEELESEMNLILAVENENQLLPTILSRGVIEYIGGQAQVSDSYWNEVRKCWSSGPSACIAFVDQLDREKSVSVMEEIITKLHLGLASEVNEKRLSILDLAITCLFELKQTNINPKLILDHFLMSSWRTIKA